MIMKFVERICNDTAIPHDIYIDAKNGVYRECIETDTGLAFTDAPPCESLTELRRVIERYDRWLSDFRAIGCDFETAVGLSDHNAAVYWRTRKWAAETPTDF